VLSAHVSPVACAWRSCLVGSARESSADTARLAEVGSLTRSGAWRWVRLTETKKSHR
jgi:hypothetical protein